MRNDPHHDPRAGFRGEKRMKVKQQILERDDFCCVICGKPVGMADSNLDHIIEIENGGTHDEDNLRTVCIPCHTKRHGGKPKRAFDATGNPIDGW